MEAAPYPPEGRHDLDRTEAVVAGGALLVSLVLATRHLPGLPCLSYVVFHVPCPGCGLTRSILALWHGHVVESLRLHPVGIVLFAVSWGAVLRSITPRKLRPLWRFADSYERWLREWRVWAVIVSAMVVLWAYRLMEVARGGGFFHW